MERRKKRLCGRNGVLTRAFSMFVSMSMVLNLVLAQGIAWAKDEYVPGDDMGTMAADAEDTTQESDAIPEASEHSDDLTDAGSGSDTEAEEELGSIRVFVDVSGVEEDVDSLAYNVTLTDAYGRWLDKQMRWVERNQSLVDQSTSFLAGTDDESNYEHVVTPSQDLVIDNVPVGIYEVRETQTGRDIDGYTFVDAESVTEVLDVVVTKDSTVEAAISNVYEKDENDDIGSTNVVGEATDSSSDPVEGDLDREGDEGRAAEDAQDGTPSDDETSEEGKVEGSSKSEGDAADKDEENGSDPSKTYTEPETKLSPSVVKEVTGGAPSETFDFTLTETTADEAMKASERLGAASASVANTHIKPAADKVTVTLTGSKTLKNGSENKAVTADQFEFAIAPHTEDGFNNPANGAITHFASSIRNDAEGKISFGTIDFTKEGIWKYDVWETSTDGNGVTVDTAVYTVTYEVQEDGQTNALTVTTSIVKKKGDVQTTVHAIEFRNTYEAAPAQVSFRGKKDLAGGTVQAGQFSFELKGTSANASGTHKSATNDAEGKFDFGTIAYTTPGDYKYTVRETRDNSSSVDIELSDHVYYVTVKVTDNNEGQLVATIVDTNDSTKTIDTENLDFTNTVLSGEVTLGVNKIVEGNTDSADFNADEEYEFTLAKATGSTHATDVIAEPNQVTMRVNESKNFGSITYKQAGTYYYSIAETPGSTVGMTYAPVQYVKVVVERSGIADSSTLKVTSVKYGPSLAALGDEALSLNAVNNVVPMVNTYAKTTFTPSITKTYEGENRPAETFKFTLTDKTADEYKPFESIEAGGNEASVAMEATDTSKEASFGTFTYTKPGTYLYEIKEVAGMTTGMQYAKDKVTLTVRVSAQPNGKLVASGTYEGGTGDAHAFNNVYDSGKNFVTAPLVATKTLNDRAPGARQFTFAVTPDVGNPTEGVDEGGLEREEHNDADGNINFGEIVFSEPGFWIYEISETSEDGDGVTKDRAVYTVQFSVSPDAAGHLTADRTITKKTPDSDSETVQRISFANTYDAADATLTLSGHKELVAGTLAKDQFSFTLIDSEDKAVDTAKNEADGSYQFKELEFDAVGTYTYTVKEVASEAEDIASDDTVYSVSVEVTDDNKGSLVATPRIVNEVTKVPVDKDELNFKNTQLRGSAQIEVNKSIPRYAGDEDFEFKLERIDGPEGGDQLPENREATTKAGGTAKFGKISYSKVGTYLYKITETKGNNAGIEYDDSTKYAKVVVSRSASKGEESDTLNCVVTYGDEASTEACTASFATFTNTVGGPAIETYVNQDVHQDLDAFDSTFTYDILAYVTADADKVVITDTLEDGITFKSDPTEVKVADLGTSNDHKVKDTVAQVGTDISDAVVTINGKKLSVEISDENLIKNLRGHWVKVTYDAQLDNSVVNTYATYENNAIDVDGNAPVLDGTEIHSGVANKAGYEVYVKATEEGATTPTMPDKPTYKKGSNTVTVTPKTTNLTVEKVWKDDSGNMLTWPEGVKATVELLRDGRPTDPARTARLSADKQTATFGGLELGPEYSIREIEVTGATLSADPVIEGTAADGYTITNTIPGEEPEDDTVSFDVQKQWQDAEGNAIDWPEGATVTVELLKNSEPFDPALTLELTADQTSGTFSDLVRADEEGNAIAYTIVETSVTGVDTAFTTTMEASDAGCTITNKLQSDTPGDDGTIEVAKQWTRDGKEIDWPEGATVTVEVFKDDESLDPALTLELTADQTSGTMTIPDYDSEAEYTLRETEVSGATAGYKVSYKESGSTYTVTNAYTTTDDPEKPDDSGKTDDSGTSTARSGRTATTSAPSLTSSTATTRSSTPKTGDPTNVSLLAGMAIVGGMLIVAGVAQRRREN